MRLGHAKARVVTQELQRVHGSSRTAAIHVPPGIRGGVLNIDNLPKAGTHARVGVETRVKSQSEERIDE